MHLHKTPFWLFDFVVYFASATTTQSEGVVSLPSNTMFAPFLSFSANISTFSEPTSYKQACKDPHWVQAMDCKLMTLDNNYTWDLINLAPGKTPIGSKWAYKTKFHPDGPLDKFKARLVVKCYHQIEGIDYNDQCYPVAKLITVWFVFNH